MQRRLDEWVRDIVAAGQEIGEYIDGLDQDQFEEDLRTVRAVAYLLLLPDIRHSVISTSKRLEPVGRHEASLQMGGTA